MLPLRMRNSGVRVVQIIWPPSDHLSNCPWILERCCLYHAFSFACSLLIFTTHRDEFLDVRLGSGPNSRAPMQHFPVFAKLYLRAHPSFEKKETSIKQVTKPISLPKCGSKIQQIWGQVVCLNLFDLYYCRRMYTALQLTTETTDYCCCCYYYCSLQSCELIRSPQITDGLRTNAKTIKWPSSSGNGNHKTHMLRDDSNRNKFKDLE